jgi:hypothetical protein
VKKTQAKKKQSESREVDDVPRRDAPTADREIETLLEQARRHLDEAKRLKGESLALGRRSVHEFYEAGRVLATIREKLKPTQHSWVGWQRKNKLSRNRVNLAIRLFEAVQDAAELERFRTIRQALRHYGLEKAPDETPPAETPPTQVVEADAATGGNHDDAADEQAEEGEDQDEPEGQKDEKQTPASPHGTPTPFLKARIRVERKTIVIDAGEIRSSLLLPREGTVRVVPRWRAELKLAVDGGEAVLIIPGLEVPGVAAG